MGVWSNLLGYQLTWLIVVSAAGHDRWWIAVAAVLTFVAWQLAVSTRRLLDIRLMGLALVLGSIVDGSLSFLGWLRYAAATPSLPPGGAPLWILALWAAFSLTIARSLAWLRGRAVLGMILGALGAPLAYLSAARGWNAVWFVPPVMRGVAALTVGWGLAVPLLVHFSQRGSVRAGSAKPIPEADPI